MTEPLDLFSRPPAQEESDTSRLAATAIQPVAAALARRVHACIAECPCTDLEGQERTGIAGDSWRPRRVDLERRGQVVADGTRPTRSGRLATVWRAVQPGEPPGERRRPAVAGGPGREAVSAGRRRQGESTPDTPPPDWAALAALRPAWMLRRQFERMVADALDATGGDSVRSRSRLLHDLRDMGGDR